MLTRREVITAIFGATFVCPRWLEALILTKHSKQIKETPQHGASARGIVERVLRGSDVIDGYVGMLESSNDWKNDPYFHGMYNGFLLAQSVLQDSEYKPI